jgi:ubiquinone/menaquinone biosynthesis C-methylase UbiE
MEQSDRQLREIEYHRHHAAKHLAVASQPVTLTELTSHRYRWWNAYWVNMWRARAEDLPNRRVLVVGSGFGEDAIRLNLFGAKVWAFDISEECCQIARQRTAISQSDVVYSVSTAETLPFADHSFDLVFLSDIIHHLDIPQSMREIRRVLRPGGVILGNEPYTHPWIQDIRNSRVVREYLYPKMVKSIYGTDTPYLTPDERKLTNYDLQQINQILPISDRKYFTIMASRIFRPTGITCVLVQVAERIILMIPFMGQFLAGRVVFTAQLDLRAALSHSGSVFEGIDGPAGLSVGSGAGPQASGRGSCP